VTITTCKLSRSTPPRRHSLGLARCWYHERGIWLRGGEGADEILGWHPCCWRGGSGGGAGKFLFSFIAWRRRRAMGSLQQAGGVDERRGWVTSGLSLPHLRLVSSRSLSLGEGADEILGWHPRCWRGGSGGGAGKFLFSFIAWRRRRAMGSLRQAGGVDERRGWSTSNPRSTPNRTILTKLVRPGVVRGRVFSLAQCEGLRRIS
jgi:hypothetical protein